MCMPFLMFVNFIFQVINGEVTQIISGVCVNCLPDSLQCKGTK